MANFKQTVITKAAHNLIAKSLSGSANINFTRVATSKYDYKSFSQSKLESLTSLEDIKQYVAVDKVEKIGEASVNVSVKITNANITEGYYVNTIGLFAMDPEEGEILYSVTVAETADYFPADNGVNCSGINLDLVTEVSNASNVNITVNYAGYATNEDIEKVNSHLNDIMNERGYVNTKIITGLDLNTIVKSGIYSGNNLINSPQNNVWYTLEVFNCSNDDYVIQRIMGFADGGTATFERRKNLTKWTAWQRIATVETATLTLLNGWVNTGGLISKVSRNGNQVTLNMCISGGTMTANTNMCVLPAQYRPSSAYLLWFKYEDSSYTAHDDLLFINIDGSVSSSDVLTGNTRLIINVSFTI